MLHRFRINFSEYQVLKKDKSPCLSAGPPSVRGLQWIQLAFRKRNSPQNRSKSADPTPHASKGQRDAHLQIRRKTVGRIPIVVAASRKNHRRSHGLANAAHAGLGLNEHFQNFHRLGGEGGRGGPGRREQTLASGRPGDQIENSLQ